MKLLDVVIQNFFSVGKTVTLDLRKRGLVGVEGENRDDPSATNNGSGKTTIFIDAPSWCLFGETSRGYSNDEVINNKIGKDCFVRVHMRVGGQDIAVTRGRKHKQYKDRIILVVDDKDQTKATNRETQDDINKLLGMNAQTFLNSVMFGATPGYRFSGLTDKQQKEVFDDALGIAEFAAAYENARAKLREAKEELDHQVDLLETVQTGIKQTKKRLRELQESEEGYEEEVARKRKQLTTLRNEGHDRRVALEKKIVKVSVKDAQHAVDVARREWDRMYTTVTDHVAQEKAQSKIVIGLKRKLEELNDNDEDYTCDTCGSDVNEDTRKRHKKHIKDDLAAEQEKFNAIKQKLLDTQQELDIIASEKKKAEKRLGEAHDAVNVNRKLEAKVQEAWRDTQDAISKLEDLDKQKSPYKPLIKKCKRELEKVTAKESELNLLCRGYEKEVDQLEFWAEGYGTKGLRSYLIDTALPFLNERVERYAQMVTDGSIEIQFKTQSKLKGGSTVDRFEVAVFNKHGADTYKGNSGGEKAKVDLCVGLALQDLVVSRAKTKTNVAFFDEVFDRMDEAGVERAVNVLTEIAKDRESVFVVTHLEALKSYFPSTITVVKRKGISRLEEL